MSPEIVPLETLLPARLLKPLLPVVTKNKKRKTITIPVFKESSAVLLAVKFVAIQGQVCEHFDLKIFENVRTYNELGRVFMEKGSAEDRIFSAYALAHELQILSLAFQAAKEAPDSHIFEIGSDNGIGLEYFASMMFESLASGQPIKKIIGYEADDYRYERAMHFLNAHRSQPYYQGIELINEDAFLSIAEKSRPGDIIVCSLAEPAVCTQLIDLAKAKSFQLIISYSDLALAETNRILGKKFCRSFPPEWQITIFEDNLWSKKITDDVSRFGLIAKPQ